MINNMFKNFVVHPREYHNFKERLESSDHVITVRPDLVNDNITYTFELVRGTTLTTVYCFPDNNIILSEILLLF